MRVYAGDHAATDLLRARLDITRRHLAAQEETRALTGWRARAGLVSALVLASATLALGSTQPTPDPALMTALARTFMAVACVATLMSAHMAWTYEGARHQAEDELRALNVALEEARRAAEAANRSKTEFLRHISHELRTPLNSVLGHGELLRDELAELGHERLVADVEIGRAHV